MGVSAIPIHENGVLWIIGSLLLPGLVDGAGDAKVFDIGSDLDPFTYTVMMTLVILGLVIFDLLLEAFEHYLHHKKGRFHQRLLKKAIKQLMILGLISFVLFILKDQAVYDQSDGIFTNTFDFVNLFLFFVGVSLVLFAVLLVIFTSPLKTRWDTYATVPLETLLTVHADITSKSWRWYAAWLPRYYRGLRQAQVIEYHLFRSVFVRLNRSLLTPAFDFSKYSASIVDEFIIIFFDVGWASWLLAIIVLFLTLPITPEEDGGAQVSAYGALVFGVVVLALECVTCALIHHAHQKVCARMGVVDGFKGVGRVLKELWVEPLHYMGQETAAIDVKDLLAAAPVNAPTLEQLTSEIRGSTHGASHAEANFKSQRGSTSSLASTRRSSNDSSRNGSSQNGGNNVGSSGSGVVDGPATADAAAAAAAVVVAPKPPCPQNGPGCTGCYECDALWLPPGRVQKCTMGGDPFVVTVVRPPRTMVGHFPDVLKGAGIKVGSYWWFKAMFGMCTLIKCYYCAFYFSYAIGRATKTDTATAVMWIVLTPLPLLLCLLPLAKRTLPIYAQLACLQGQIVWELVSDIEEQQEMAARARDKVIQKLQETLAAKTEDCNAMAKKDGAFPAAPGEAILSPRSRATKDWFAEWDIDGNGQISRDELAKGLQKLGVFLSEVQLKELFRLADPDHSKSIDLEEFRAFLSDLRSLEHEPGLFQQEVELRIGRSSRVHQERRESKIIEMGLLSESYAAFGGGSRRRFRPLDRAMTMGRVVNPTSSMKDAVGGGRGLAVPSLTALVMMRKGEAGGGGRGGGSSRAS